MLGYAQTLLTPAPARLSVGSRVSTHHSLTSRLPEHQWPQQSGEPASGLAVLSFRHNVWYDGPVAVLDELYVRPDRRGCRLGSALLTAACDLVRSRGGELLEINVDGDAIEARRFYEARGFCNSEPDHTDQLLYYCREL